MYLNGRHVGEAHLRDALQGRVADGPLQTLERLVGQDPHGPHARSGHCKQNKEDYFQIIIAIKHEHNQKPLGKRIKECQGEFLSRKHFSLEMLSLHNVRSRGTPVRIPVAVSVYLVVFCEDIKELVKKRPKSF